MKLLFNRPYKSIQRFLPIELPSFTVLTGVNGAGKSHLLEAIESNAVTIEGVPPNQQNGEKPIRRFDWNSLVPQDTGAFSSAQISSEQSGFWNEVIQHRAQQLSNLYDSLRQFEVPALERLDARALPTLRETDLLGMGLDQDRANTVLQHIRNHINNAEQNTTQMFIRGDPANRTRLVSAISKSTSLPFVAMKQDDFYRAYPRMWQPIDLFQQSFARLFSAYQRHWAQNKLKEIGHAAGEAIEALSEADFLAKHGQPPWDFLNEILETAELDFRINEPYKWDDRPYEPILSDIKRGTQVKFNDLSSGERVLMSFALCLYHAADPNSAVDFPRVLLFDEIDAPLHPSMTRSLLRTIQQTLVEKHNIAVILTTHSPSTVALAPDASIHVMRKLGDARLSQTSKDCALGILTAGVPTLSINYENRRQVFVESKYDVQYYSALYERCKPFLLPDVSLMFIASAPGGNGNCDQVCSIVGQLTAGGNRTVLGIIDWDTKNSSSAATLVVGEGERYSIENFLLDPVPLGFLLIREKFVQPKSLGLSADMKYVDMHSLSQADLQALADVIVSKVEGQTTEAELVVFKYVNNQQVVVPKWFAYMQGHLLEERVKSAFPQLKKYHQEPDLKMAIVRLVLEDYPHLVPFSVLTLFQQIQRAEYT